MQKELDYTVLGVSSGIGVSLYPFKEHVTANYEIRSIFHSQGDKQWKANFPRTALFRRGEEHYLPPKRVIDVIIASPDCGSGSVLRFSRAKKLGDHRKNESLALFFTMMNKHRPKFFLFENLDGLFKSFPEDEFRKNLKYYRLIMYNVPVSVFGNSQKTRKRLIIVGIRKDLPKKLLKKFKLPKEKDLKICAQLMHGLKSREIPEIAHVREDLDTPIAIHAGRKMTPREIMKEWQEKRQGKRRWETPEYNFSTAPGVYRNMAGDYPATARKANRQFDHIGMMLTPRQLARIQGVPDEFIIYYDPNKPLYWINKGRAAVTKTPPYEISVWFKQKLEKSYSLWSSKP